MKIDSPFWIGDVNGFGAQIGRLVGMLSYARRTTLNAVRGLTTEQLDHLQDPDSNSIGMLLAHIAAVEFSYQVHTFEDRDLTEDERHQWAAALHLGDAGRTGIRGMPLEQYLQRLETVRTGTLLKLGEVSDDWLDRSTPFWDNQPANNYFKWFHVLEDEINHRGQIRWLRRRLPL